MWWRSNGLEEMSFERWWIISYGQWEHQCGYKRKMATKLYALMTIVDDVYDVYGTLDELELSTDVVKRFLVMAIIINMIYCHRLSALT